MRIGYIHDSEMPGDEASTVNVAKMCDAFVANGHRPLLLHLSGAGRRISEHYGLKHDFRAIGLPIPRHAPSRKKLFAYAATMIVRAASPAIVYGRKPVFLLPALRMGLPIVLELHSLLGEREVAAKAALRTMLASPRLLRIVAISHALADDIAAEWPKAVSRLVVAHDGADPQGGRFLPVPRPNANRPCVGYAGHLYPGKGMEMIAALAALRPDIDFVVLGGRAVDLARWKGETAELGNLCLRGMVPHAEVPAHLADCDVALAPYSSRVEVSDGKTDVARWMSPLKIFEYMAQSRAIMASNLPVIGEILQDGETAALCPPDDPAGWAARLDRLLVDSEGRQRMGQRARAVFEAHYTWSRRAELVLKGLSG